MLFNIAPFIVFEGETVMTALEKMNRNKSKVVFVVGEGGILQGSLTDGDFRRWLTAASEFDLNVRIETLANPAPRSVRKGTPPAEIIPLFGQGVDVVPVIDDARRVVAIAKRSSGVFRVGEREISATAPAFIIAEVGNNHNGSVALAKELSKIAAEAGADCVKFQMRNMDALYKMAGKSDSSADLGAQYTHDLLSRFQLTNDELFEVFDYCKLIGILPLCTPWDATSLALLEDYGMPAYKVASADFTNHTFLEEIARTGKGMFCSTGMSTEAEIVRTNTFLREIGADYVLLHCNSTYPTPFKDVQLKYLNRLAEITGRPIGYSGHERGVSVPVAAVAIGAKVIEKHITVDKSMEGNDHKVSLLPHEIDDMVRMIREVEESLGTANERVITQGEMINRETLAKSIIASRPIAKGQRIERESLDIKSPGQGLQPIYLEQLIGKEAKRDFDPGAYFFDSDLADEVAEPRPYHFDRPFGVPVRYHDYGKLIHLSNLDFVEFHLSYQDLELDFRDFFDTVQEGMGFAVHSPELFSGDHILDLTSDDPAYRARSISELNRVCAITRELKTLFPATETPAIVVNAGGFSENSFLSPEARPALYDRVAAALAEIDTSGVAIAIQTMPPFPWHFGGQRHHNLFVHPAEIDAFCSAHGVKVCFDSSHTLMASNHGGWSFYDNLEKILKHTIHMHIVDAQGVDGEGVQIGEGDMDFHALWEAMADHAPGVSFIPEVWQGHKNNGEGFWHALDFLERFVPEKVIKA